MKKMIYNCISIIKVYNSYDTIVIYRKEGLMKKLLSRRILLILSLISAAFLFFVLFEAKMLPLKYYIPVVVGVLLFLVLLYVGEKDKEHEHTIRSTLIKLVHILLSILMIVASLYTMKYSNFLDSITGRDEQIIEIDVVVMKGTTYQTIEDLKEQVFGASFLMDPIDVNKTQTLIEDEIGEIEMKQFASDNEAIKALQNNEIQAFIIKGVDLESLNEIQEGFEETIRILKKYELRIPSLKATSAQVTKETFNVLISGMDKKGEIERADALSDVNMIATINPKTKQILITSIPRDYYVDLYKDNYNYGKDKLTHSAKKGIQCTQETVEQLLGIDINYYAKFNFTSFMNVVDALGGIDIDIPKYSVFGNDEGIFTTWIYKYEMRPGLTTMDGKHALAFVRERKSFKAGDNIRNKNQMIMLKAIVKKACSPAILTKVDKVLASISNSFTTNMSSNDIKSLVNMQVDDMSSWDIQTYHLEGDASKRTTKFATVSEEIVYKSNKKGLFVMEPYMKSVEQAKQYIDVIEQGQEILKIKE